MSTCTAADPPAVGQNGPLPATRPGPALLDEMDSQALLQGRREVRIRHQGQMYRLQATRQGKLILTK